MQRLLLVEDDQTLAFGLQAYLQKQQFAVRLCASLQAARAALREPEQFQLVLLDWNLPDGSGLDFCRWLKEQGSLPVIFLTVRDEERDIVRGLDLGADDYVLKPFQPAVLLSRIKAVLRRAAAPPGGNLLTCGPVRLDREKTQVWLREECVTLTAGEYRLLLLLLENKNKTLPRNLILERLWDIEADFVNDNTLTVTVKRLREKLDGGAFIKTVRGIGYRAEEDEDA